MLKKLSIFVLLFLLIVSICLVCAAYFLKPFLKEKFLELAESNLGKRVEVSQFDIRPLKGLVFLRGVKIEDCKGIKYHNAASADEIILDIDLPSTLLQRNLVFRKIYLKNCAFGLNNRKGPLPLSGEEPQAIDGLIKTPQPIKETSAELENSEATLSPPKPKTALNTLYIKRILIEDSKFFFEDYSVPLEPAIIEIVNINGTIEGLSISLLEGGTLKGAVDLNGRLDSKDGSSLKLDGPFTKIENEISFDFNLNFNNLDLIRFSPYYSNTSFTILKKATLDLKSKASCLRNRINACQDVHIFGIELYDIKPGGDDKLFGLPAKTVIDFFRDSKGDIEFGFNIVGTIDDPRFDPGPIIKQVLSNALRDKIVARLQELPREVIEMGEKAINENLGKVDSHRQDEIVEIIHDIGKMLKKMIPLKP